MEKKNVLIILLGLLLIFVYAFPSEHHDKVSNTMNILIGMMPLFFGYLAITYFGMKNKQSKAIFLLCCSVFLWVLADFLWWSFYHTAVVSFSDLLWLIGYPLIFASVIMGIKLVDEDILKDRKKLLYAGIAILVLFAIYLYFFPISWDSHSSILENLVTSGYVLADMILIIPIVLLVSTVIDGKYSYPWIMIGIGILLTMFGDLYYAINYETYQAGDLVDMAWYLTYIFYSLAFVRMRSASEHLVRAVRRAHKK